MWPPTATWLIATHGNDRRVRPNQESHRRERHPRQEDIGRLSRRCVPRAPRAACAHATQSTLTPSTDAEHMHTHCTCTHTVHKKALPASRVLRAFVPGKTVQDIYCVPRVHTQHRARSLLPQARHTPVPCILNPGGVPEVKSLYQWLASARRCVRNHNCC